MYTYKACGELNALFASHFFVISIRTYVTVLVPIVCPAWFAGIVVVVVWVPSVPVPGASPDQI